MMSFKLRDSPSVRKQSKRSIVFATIGTRYLSDVRLLSRVLLPRFDFIPKRSLRLTPALLLTTIVRTLALEGYHCFYGRVYITRQACSDEPKCNEGFLTAQSLPTRSFS